MSKIDGGSAIPLNSLPIGPRPLYRIAADIKADLMGKKVPYGAVPYLEAMSSLVDISDSYFADSAEDVVLYLLSNLQTWRGPVARAIKAELKAMVGIK